MKIEVNEGIKLSNDIDIKYINSYINNDIIEKFRKDNQYTENSAAILFNELKKYLIICADSRLAIPPSKAVDNMWHSFILFTSAYTDFCNKSFNRYMHHAPNIGQTGQQLKVEPFAKTVEILKVTFSNYNEHFWSGDHKAPGDGDEGDDNGCTHNECGPVLDDYHDPK